jgi:DNA mismatch repair protein MutS
LNADIRSLLLILTTAQLKARRKPNGDADDGPVLEIKEPPIRIRCCSTGWAISTSCSSRTRWIASRALGITLTKRGKHQGEDIPMCGVPVHAADDYLQKLIAQGFPRRRLRTDRRPGGSQETRLEIGGRRDVVRLVTPGTLTEESCSIHRQQLPDGIGADQGRAARSTALAWIDISTGQFHVGERPRPAAARPILPGSSPRELIVADTCAGRRELRPLSTSSGARHAGAGELFRQRHGGRPAGAVLRRQDARRVRQPSAGRNWRQPRRRSPMSRRPRFPSGRRWAGRSAKAGARMFIDPATRASLELVRTLSGERQGSLIKASTAR